MEGCFKGCVGIVIIVVALHFIIKIGGCLYDEAKDTVGKATAWRDEQLAKKAQEEELKRMQQVEVEQAAEFKRRQEASAAEAKKKRLAKDEKIQTFALKEAPKVWAVYQNLQSEIDVQDGKIMELRKTLEMFNKVPEQDADYINICALRDEMIRSRKALRAKLEDAYIAAKKYEAAPSRKDYQELQKKALEDGILEADAASAKFKEMRFKK